MSSSAAVREGRACRDRREGGCPHPPQLEQLEPLEHLGLLAPRFLSRITPTFRAWGGKGPYRSCPHERRVTATPFSNSRFPIPQQARGTRRWSFQLRRSGTWRNAPVRLLGHRPTPHCKQPGQPKTTSLFRGLTRPRISPRRRKMTLFSSLCHHSRPALPTSPTRLCPLSCKNDSSSFFVAAKDISLGKFTTIP